MGATQDAIDKAEALIAQYEVQYSKAEADLDALGLRIAHARRKLENVKRLAGDISEVVNAG